MKVRTIHRQQNNEGFSVISVLIAISFIGILAMLVLYISTANFQMKMTDLKAKDSFYTAEIAMDEIRVGLQQEVGNAMSVAYISVLEKYADRTDSSAGGESLNDLRKDEFNKGFVRELVKRLKGSNQDEYSLPLIDSYIDSKPEATSAERLKLTAKNGKPEMEDYVPLVTSENESKTAGVLLKNLKIVYEDAKGRASIIETDIRLHIPEVTFPEPSTVPDLMSMIIVANEGIVCEGNNVIQGTIYAGNSIKGDKPSIDINGKVEINGGEYLVCNGDINIKSGSTFICKADELWANNINVTSADVELLDTTYIADDLTIDTLAGSTTNGNAKGSNVKISGNYYGFGSASGWNKAKAIDKQYEDRSITASESAIIINGKGTVLDMSALDRLLLAGNSYIPTSSDGQKDILMGESITVKGNQLAYLLPTEYLPDLNGAQLTNPLPEDKFLKVKSDEYSYNRPAASLGGLTLQDLVDLYQVQVTYQLRPHQDGVYAYYYLYFTDHDKASQFFEKFYNDYQKESMDKYLSFYLNKEKGIEINPQVLTRFITKGNVLQYEGSKGKLYSGKSKLVDESVGEQTDYMNKWFTLTRKMIENYNLLKTNVGSSDTEAGHNETDRDRHVFENLINEKKLKDYLNGMPQKEGKQVGSYNALLVNNIEYEVTAEDAGKYKLIVSTGNVTVSGVKFKGIIMAGGQITLNTGATLQSDPREAAKVFQAQDDGFKEIFWEGSNYVLGNVSDTTEDGEKSEQNDIYDLAQSVTYEHWSKK